MTYEEALQYIHGPGMHSAKPGLSRMCALMDALGNPQKDLRFIHVAGTNGKGSVCAMLDSILRSAGYRVGLYTSPFVLDFRERIRFCGEMIPEETLSQITEQVRTVAERLQISPTEFELITAIALVYYRSVGADPVVFEVGLGGRLDPTNVIETPLLSIITDIDFDHTKLLGNTIQAIAAEKAGIIKTDHPCLFGGTDGSASRTVRMVAECRHSAFYTVDRQSFKVREMTLDGTVFDFQNYEDLHLPLLGSYQPVNAATVLTAIDLLRENGLAVSDENVRAGLEKVRWQARFEILERDPTVIFDGGHNPQGIRAAVKSVQTYFPGQKIPILTAVMADKDYDAMIEDLKPIADRIFTTQIHNLRVLPAEEYAKRFEEHNLPAEAIPDLAECFEAARKEARKAGQPLLCIGSLYLYSELTKLIKS